MDRWFIGPTNYLRGKSRNLHAELPWEEWDGVATGRSHFLFDICIDSANIVGQDVQRQSRLPTGSTPSIMIRSSFAARRRSVTPATTSRSTTWGD